ncbi:hypothetical protein HDU84_000999, partial [Entophlyctis sp. JEL0112]
APVGAQNAASRPATPSFERESTPSTVVGEIAGVAGCSEQREPGAFEQQESESRPRRKRACRKLVPGGPAVSRLADPNSATRKFECPVCSKQFSRRANMGTHMETHLRDRPRILCEECPKTFYKKCALTRHVQTVHRLRRRGYVCTRCCKSFSRPDAATRHMGNCCQSV